MTRLFWNAAGPLCSLRAQRRGRNGELAVTLLTAVCRVPRLLRSAWRLPTRSRVARHLNYLAQQSASAAEVLRLRGAASAKCCVSAAGRPAGFPPSHPKPLAWNSARGHSSFDLAYALRVSAGRAAPWRERRMCRFFDSRQGARLALLSASPDALRQHRETYAFCFSSASSRCAHKRN